MARVKHTLQNGVVHLRQQNSGKLAAIDVSLYEYINEEDKPSDEYVFRNGGSSTFNFMASGNTETSTITSQYGHEGSWSNVPFSCTEKPEWVTVNTTATSVSVRADENTETSIRAGSVVLTQDTSNKKITIAVSQAAAESQQPEPQDEWIFTADKTSFSFNAESGSDSLISGLQTDGATITSTHNGSWVDFTIDGGSALGGAQKFDDWLIVTKTHESGNTATLAIGVTKNASNESRSQSFTLTQGDGSSESITITVTQAAKAEDEWVFTADRTSFTAEASGSGTDLQQALQATGTTITSSHNGSWVDFEIEGGSALGAGKQFDNWLIVASTHTSGTTATLSIGTIPNTTGQERSTSFTIKQNGSNDTISFDVTQSAIKEEATWELSMTPNPANHNAKSGDMAVSVTSTKNGEKHPWHIGIQTQVDWVTAKENTDDITLTFQENNQTEQRSTTLSITQEDSNKSATLNITQDATTYVFTISPVEAGHNNTAGSVDITVTSTKDGADQPWNILHEPYHEWVSVSKGDGKVTVTFEANSEHNERRDTATVQQEGSNEQKVISIKQSAADDVYVFKAEPLMINVESEGKTETITVDSKLNDADHEWDITTQPDNWCTVTKKAPSLEIVISSNKKEKENTQERSTKVVITQNDSRQTQTIDITQKGYTQPETFTYTFDNETESDIMLPASNAEGHKITVTSYKTGTVSGQLDVDYSYTKDDWITVSKEDDGIRISAQDNSSGPERTGKVTLTQNESNKTLEISVRQSAAGA